MPSWAIVLERPSLEWSIPPCGGSSLGKSFGYIQFPSGPFCAMGTSSGPCMRLSQILLRASYAAFASGLVRTSFLYSSIVLLIDQRARMADDIARLADNLHVGLRLRGRRGRDEIRIARTTYPSIGGGGGAVFTPARAAVKAAVIEWRLRERNGRRERVSWDRYQVKANV